MDVFKAFENIPNLRVGEAYQPQLVLVREDTPEAVRAVLSKAHCNWIVSIGSRMTTTLHGLFKEINPIPTTFLGILDPVERGLINSLERPGGWMSGVRTLDVTPQSYAYEGSQECLRFLLPVSPKILMPYDLAAWGEDQATAVQDNVMGVAAELTRMGFEPVVKQVSGREEALACVKKYQAECLVISSSWLPPEFESELVYQCGMVYPKRIVVSSNERDGLRHGAALLVRRKKPVIVIPDLVRMVRQGWYEHIWPGVQPVNTTEYAATDPMELVVNPFMLPTLPVKVYEELKNSPDVVIENKWPLPESQLNKLGKEFKV
jgi:hypothetical protein